MCKIISISGSHGVGKTSLFNLIMEDSYLLTEKIKYFKEFNGALFNMGFSLNGKGYDFDEVIFSQSKAFYLGYDTAKYYLAREQDDRLIITDRSCIDTYIYTDYFLSENSKYIKKYSDLLENMKNKSKEILQEVKHIFLPPFKDFEVLENRMSASDRDAVWDNFKNHFLNNENNNITVLSSNTTVERHKEIINIMKAL